MKYEINLGSNLLSLLTNVKKLEFEVIYRIFYVQEGQKTRKIYAPSLESMIIQHALYFYIYKYIDNKFINNSFACRIGKGIHTCKQSVYKSFRSVNSTSFYLQLDIHKFFYSISSDILLSILKQKYFKEQKLIELIAIFLKLPDTNIGVPIGNLLSQIFANVYMNEVDQYIKLKYPTYKYARYMDDFVIIGIEKYSIVEDIRVDIEKFIDTELNLKLSKFKIAKIQDGINFAGYRIFTNKILIRKYHLKRIKSFSNNDNEKGVLSLLGLSKNTHNYKKLKELYT